MKTSKTKKRFLLSLVAVIACVAMLVGTTMAWFTDSVTSGKNIIKSGNLDVEMYYADGTEDPANATWDDASDATIFNYELWEPGYTDVKHIKIANVGTLALKYQLVIVPDGPVGDLAKVLDVYASVGSAVQAANRTDLEDTDKFTKLGTLEQVLANTGLDLAGNLMPAGTEGKTCENTLTIAVKMQETAGNEYQGKAVANGFTVVVKATQYTYEEDSFDYQYDKGATYPVVSNEEFAKALEEAKPGDSIKLLKNTKINLPDDNYEMPDGVSIVGEEGSVLKVSGANALKLNGGNKISNVTIEATNNGDKWEYNSAIDIEGNNVTLENVKVTSPNRDTPIKIGAINSDDNIIVIKNCTIDAAFKGIHIVDGSKGKIIIDNCNISAVYPFNVNTTSNPEVVVKNSTLNGWTSYSGTAKKVTFEDCSFGTGHGYAVLMAYADTNLTNCTFANDFEVYTKSGQAKTITFTNCNKNGTKITSSNVNNIFDENDSDSIRNAGWTVVVN